MVGCTDYVVYPVVQFILQVHQLLFSEDLDLDKKIDSSTLYAFIWLLVTSALCLALSALAK